MTSTTAPARLSGAAGIGVPDAAASESTSESPVCEHGWVTESRHRTSEGIVLYVRCASCGIRRVDLLPGPWAPMALSRPVGG